ncbi:MAG: hypothetical protein ACFFB2_05495 [Promethearchaeota archaeon]
MYRQNTVLNDFVNFLKARGRFREIEFIENSVHATPRIPDLPSLVFYIEEDRQEQYYTLEIHGNESTVMNREIQEFFHLNQLGLKTIKVKFYLTTEGGDSLIVETEGIGSPFDTLVDQINSLFDTQQYSINSTQKTLIFSSNVTNSNIRQLHSAQIAEKQTRIQSKSPKNSLIEPKIELRRNTHETPYHLKQTHQNNEISRENNNDQLTDIITSPEEVILSNIEKRRNKSLSFSTDKPKSPDQIISSLPSEGQELFDFKKEPSSKSSQEDDLFEHESSIEDLEKDLFHPKPPQKDYSRNIKPYLKQTTSLFRRDNWEEDLPTELEMEILERTYMRIKHRTKPEILAKDLNIPIDDAEIYLRSLIAKGLLRTQVGWYIIKKSHLPFFKKTFSDGEKKKKKKKSPRISRVGEGLTQEEISTIKAIKSRPNLKAQSNLLTRPTGLKQSVLKEVLRNLVEKGILRVSYGWYILKDKHILEHKRGPITENAPETKYKIPKNLDLTQFEEKVIQALLQRPHYKAQSNLLAPDLKMPKEQIKQVLRDLVEKNICNVKFGWYCLKDPKQFQKA